jgi:hypothetical protein
MIRAGEEGAMIKKAIALITLAAFIHCSTACMTMRTRDVRETGFRPSFRARILNVVTTSGATYWFTKSHPARVRGNAIVGTAMSGSAEAVELDGPFLEVRKRADGDVYEIVDGSGKVYSIGKVVKTDGARWIVLVNFTGLRPVSIPIKEVELVRVWKVNALATGLIVSVTLGLGLFILGMWAYADM